MRPTVSTTTGDKGSTKLFGGKTVSKEHPRIHAYGTIDELNAIIGMILSGDTFPSFIEQQLTMLQHDLFCLGADLAAPMEKAGKQTIRIASEDIQRIEEWGYSLERELPSLQHFILPSGSRSASELHLARTVCRRAERWIVSLSQEEEINTCTLVYINRLSDYLFLLARMINKQARIQEREWRG